MQTALRFILFFLTLTAACFCLFLLYTYTLKKFDTGQVFLNEVYVISITSALLISGLVYFGRPALYKKISFIGLAVIRFTLSGIFIFYAMGKLFHLQFVVDSATLNTEAGKLTGFQKAWLFFAHSDAYNLTIAAAQIIAALLILIPRTQTLAALLFVVLLGNITLIDFSYGVESMKVLSLQLLCFALLVLCHDAKRLFNFAVNRTAVPVNEYSGFSQTGKDIIMGVLLLLFSGCVVNEYYFFRGISNALPS